MGLFLLKSTEEWEESGAVNMSKVSVILLHKQQPEKHHSPGWGDARNWSGKEKILRKFWDKIMKMFSSDSESDVPALSPLQARKSRTGMV